MPTGACGINCDVCKLRLLGTCSSCGPGRSMEAVRKLGAQQRIFGGNCLILECARMNLIDYCMRDCSAFPCEKFSMGPYPFSDGFISMQQRRRKERPPALNHNLTPVAVPPEYWETVKTRDINELCNLILAAPFPDESSDPKTGLLFRFLNEDILVDMSDGCLKRKIGGQWKKTDDPLLELVTLVYLNNVKTYHSTGKNIVGVKDLKEAHFFRGQHALRLDPLLERYGSDAEGFRRAAEYLEGKPVDMADVSYMLLPFPRVPLYYLLWEGDHEFDSKISVLFDRSIEKHFSADAIWGIVHLVTVMLVQGPASEILFR